MKNLFENKRILITGVCGSIGRELLKQLLDKKSFSPKEIVGVDNSEKELFYLEHKYQNNNKLNFFLLDVRDSNDVLEKTRGIDIIFHCAALKHVAFCERSPEQAIATNVVGIQNLISAVRINSIEKMIFASSDKAVNPTNVMGTSKLMGERLMTAANSNSRSNDSIFVSTRFGNVLGSNGSVVPIFNKQIIDGGPITITHKEMTRFIMSIQEAVSLLIESSLIAKGGEIFVTKMPVLKIVDLAEAMCNLLIKNDKKNKIGISFIGTKPGEKLYEELMSEEERRRSIEVEKYFIILPAFRGFYKDIDYSYENIISKELDKVYNSSIEEKLSVTEIERILNKYDILNKSNYSENKRYWPGETNDN